MEDAVTQSILEKFLVLGPILDERAKRLWAAAEARSLGRPRQPEGGAVPAARRSGGVGGHEEEGTGGNFRNGGREWRPKGEPEEVLVHDFKDGELGKAIPYGVYDLAANSGG